MKVGDLVRFKNKIGVSGNVFLIVRTKMAGFDQKVWIYPDPDADEGYDHTDDDNYYCDHFFEVINEGG
tara:strand:- start:120 stop:323 length:204 start_codon:yes stop_codon:yes gene_type:complete